MKSSLTILLAGGLLMQAGCSNKITLLDVAGPTKDVLDIVLVPSHYYGANAYDNQKWRADAEAVRAELMNHHFWSRHRERINIIRLNRSTSDDFFLTSTGQWIPDDNRIKAFASGHFPGLDFSQNDQIIFIVDSDGYDSDPMRTPGLFPTRGDPNIAKIETSRLNVLVHEFGHSFGDLGDEYDKAVTTATWTSPYPNFATQQPGNTCNDLWGGLMNVVTPSLILNEPRADRIVGCFPANRSSSAAPLFRPTQDMCLMDTNSADSPFCPVCMRHLASLMARYSPPVTCSGAPGLFTSRAAFTQTATTPMTSVDFDTDSNGSAISAGGLGVVIEDQYADDGVRFTAGVIFGDPNSPFGGVSPPNVLTDTSKNLPERAPVAGYFVEPTCAVGLTNTGSQAELRAYDAGFNLIDTIRSDSNATTDDFIGLRTDRPIHRFEFDVVAGTLLEGDDLLFSQE